MYYLLYQNIRYVIWSILGLKEKARTLIRQLVFQLIKINNAFLSLHNWKNSLQMFRGIFLGNFQIGFKTFWILLP